MRLDPQVEEARKIVREAIVWARDRGLTNTEAMAEASEMLGVTRSRIWTLLYRPDTLRTIPPEELRKIELGHVDVLELQLEVLRSQAEYTRKLLAAVESEPSLPLIAKPMLPWGQIWRQTESTESTAAGRPLWRHRGPQKRPRKKVGRGD